MFDIDDENRRAAHMFFQGRGNVDLTGFHDWRQRSDILDTSGTALANDANNFVHASIINAAQNGCVPNAQKTARRTRNGYGEAATVEPIYQIAAVVLVDNGKD
jgi:hypothetical protein